MADSVATVQEEIANFRCEQSDGSTRLYELLCDWETRLEALAKSEADLKAVKARAVELWTQAEPFGPSEMVVHAGTALRYIVSGKKPIVRDATHTPTGDVKP
jgi:hypothetical protein